MRRTLLWLLCLLLLPWAALGETELTAPKEIIGYGENRLTLSAGEAGTAELWLLDEAGPCRQLWSGEVSPGEQEISWDGLGANEEQLMQFGFSLELRCAWAGGETETLTVPVTAGRSLEAVVYALPLSDTYYLEEDWWAEVAVSRPCTVVMEVLDDTGASLGTVKKDVKGFTAPVKLRWDGKVNRQPLPEGEYTLRYWAEGTPDWVRSFPVTLREGSAPVLPIALRDRILPTVGASDAEIWALMREPGCVVTLKATSHQIIYSEKSRHCKSLGTLRGRSQVLRVLENDGDGWVRIGAWEHETITYVEGWVPADHLQMVWPQGHYGLLVDKASQTMVVFRDGKRIGTLAVSTGVIVGSRVDRETTPGLFFTQEHMSDYSTNGHKYDYVIRYDGGNLMHQLAYHTSQTERDFTEQGAVFGTKASHGCVRLPAHPSGDGGINAYWLWTHIPFGTPIMILPDD